VHVIEYAGSTIQALGEGRLTICNMSIEAGARAGMVAPDDTTFASRHGRPHAPKGAEWDKAVAYWGSLRSDADAQFDRDVHLSVVHPMRVKNSVSNLAVYLRPPSISIMP
jgi:3-isopropylmalate/(R)-2-methylmalate dehydratase large subunit